MRPLSKLHKSANIPVLNENVSKLALAKSLCQKWKLCGNIKKQLYLYIIPGFSICIFFGKMTRQDLAVLLISVSYIFAYLSKQPQKSQIALLKSNYAGKQGLVRVYRLRPCALILNSSLKLIRIWENKTLAKGAVFAVGGGKKDNFMKM